MKKRYVIYWKVVVTENNEIHEKTNSCDIIASNFVKAVEWLNNNRKDFNLEFISSVSCFSDINIAE